MEKWPDFQCELWVLSTSETRALICFETFGLKFQWRGRKMLVSAPQAKLPSTSAGHRVYKTNQAVYFAKSGPNFSGYFLHAPWPHFTYSNPQGGNRGGCMPPPYPHPMLVLLGASVRTRSQALSELLSIRAKGQ